MANGIYQNTIYGIAAKLPFKYTGAVVLGSNISGCFTAVLSIISEVMFTGSARTAAIYYFITALFILLICFDTYFALPLNVSLSCYFKNILISCMKSFEIAISLLTIFLFIFRNSIATTSCSRRRTQLWPIPQTRRIPRIALLTGKSSSRLDLNCSTSSLSSSSPCQCSQLSILILSGTVTTSSSLSSSSWPLLASSHSTLLLCWAVWPPHGALGWVVLLIIVIRNRF